LDGTATVEILINSRVVSISAITTNPTTIDYEDSNTNRTQFNSGDNLSLRVTNDNCNILHCSLYLIHYDPASTVPVRQTVIDPTTTLLFPPDYDFLVLD
jgi:hypothetical protein